MSEFRDTEEASDARFNVPYPNEEQIDRGGFVPPSATRYTAPSDDRGLHYQLNDNTMLVDVGRSFEHTPQVLIDLPTLDLRIILAHLDSAAKQVQRELDSRHGR